MKRLFVTLGMLVQLMPACWAADQQPSQWHSVDLWSNDILAARMLFLSPASLTDENIVVFEFDNRGVTTLDVDQAFLNLDADRKDPSSGKSVSTGGITGGVLYIGKLAPGVTTVKADICKAAGAGLGLPPHGGYLVDMTVHCDARLRDGRDFSTPQQGVAAHMEWKYPEPNEIENAKERLRTLLANPEHTFGHSAQLNCLVIIPEVADSLTVDELLSSIRVRSDSVDGRTLISWIIARRFANDPKVVAYYLERLSASDPAALSDLGGNLQLWNPAWIEPLVVNFETGGDENILWTLNLHRGDWVANRQLTSRLSAALFKYRPILHKELASLAGKELFSWCLAAKEIGVVGDKALIPVLVPALDDKRIVRHPLTQMVTPPDNRVCDAALSAVLTVLDGNPDFAFKKAGVKYWPFEHDDKVRFTALDRMITLTKERLK